MHTIIWQCTQCKMHVPLSELDFYARQRAGRWLSVTLRGGNLRWAPGGQWGSRGCGGCGGGGVGGARSVGLPHRMHPPVRCFLLAGEVEQCTRRSLHGLFFGPRERGPSSAGRKIYIIGFLLHSQNVSLSPKPFLAQNKSPQCPTAPSPPLSEDPFCRFGQIFWPSPK